MRTTPRPDNPYGYDRYGFAWEHVPAGGAVHLDFGCGDGRFLAQLKAKQIGSLIGADIDRDAVKRAKAEGAGRYDIVHVNCRGRLPFPDRTFSSATLLDVLEHVENQPELLNELHRVLKDDGRLVVTVPGRHLFSFLDIGNLKFRFPRLHRWYYCRKHSAQEYQRRYGANPDGLIGDVAAAKRWHEHFSRAKLNRVLTEGGFTALEFDGAGYFLRPLKILAWALAPIRCRQRGVDRLMAADARSFESANLFCVAEKTRPSERF